MSPHDVARDALLAAAVAIEVGSCVGLVRARTAYDRLHYLVPATALAPVFLVAAIVVEEGTSTATVKAVLIGIALVSLSPVIGHASARAIRIREFGHWIVMPQEKPAEERRQR